MDHAVCLWVCPILYQKNPRNPAPPDAIPPTSDLPERYSYPHLSTTAVHTDYVDCIEFYNDFILSKSSREGKIVLWRVHGFDSQRKVDDIKNIILPPTPHEYKETRSAFGDSVERLMQFDIKNCEPWFMKFGLFSSPVDPSKLPAGVIGPGHGTFLAMGNSAGSVYIWDLNMYEASLTSASAKGDSQGRSLNDPFTFMKPHTTLVIPKVKRMIRMMAWSTWGDWLVGVGDQGLLCVWQVGKE
jgi:polycomb protein EED